MTHFLVKERSSQERVHLRARTEVLDSLTTKERACVRIVEMNTRLALIFHQAELHYLEHDTFLFPDESLSTFDVEVLAAMHRYMLLFSDCYHELMIEAHDPSLIDDNSTDPPLP